MGFLTDFGDAHTDPWGGERGPYEPKELPRDPLGKYAPHNILAEKMRPKRPLRPEHERQLYETAVRQRGEAGLFSPLVRQRLADIGDTTDERLQARGTANADVMQQVRGGSPFDRAMTRGKALSRVALQGEQAVLQQNIRDRVGMARFGQGLRSGTNRELGALSQLSAERTASSMRADQERTSMVANTLGTIAGAGFNRWQNRGTGNTAMTSNAGSGYRSI